MIAIASCWAHGLETTDTWQQKGRRGGKLLLFVSSAPGTIHYSVSDPLHAAGVSSCLANSFFPRFAAENTNIMHDSMTMPPTVTALDVFGGNYVKHLMQTLQSQHFSFSRFFLGNLPYPSGVCNFQTQTWHVKQVKDPKSWCSSLFWRSFGFDCPLAWTGRLQNDQLLNNWMKDHKWGARIVSNSILIEIGVIVTSHLFWNQILTCGLTQDFLWFQDQMYHYSVYNVKYSYAGQRCF